MLMGAHFVCRVSFPAGPTFFVIGLHLFEYVGSPVANEPTILIGA